MKGFMSTLVRCATFIVIVQLSLFYAHKIVREDGEVKLEAIKVAAKLAESIATRKMIIENTEKECIHL